MFSWSRVFMKCLFVCGIVLGLLSSSFFVIWLMLDLSTLLFLFLIFNLKLNYVNNLIHYYLLQVSASIGLFVGVLFSFSEMFDLESFFLSLKLGVFPFHYWYFSLLLKLEWWNMFVLMSLSKVLVLTLLYYFKPALLFFFCLVNLFFVIFSCIYEKRLKILLGLSSLFNVVWVMSCFDLGAFWFVYFVGYTMNLFFMIFLVSSMSYFITSGSVFLNSFFVVVFLGLLVFMVLGLPPFLSFFLKVYLVFELLGSGLFYFLLIFFSIFFIYIYLMFFFNSLTGLPDYFFFLGHFFSFYFVLVFLVNLMSSLFFCLIYYLNNMKCSS